MPSSQGSSPEKPRKTAGNGADRGLAQQSGGGVFQSARAGSARDIYRGPPHSDESVQVVRRCSVGNDRFKGQLRTMKEQVMGAVESIEKLCERRSGITGLSTGFIELDRLTSGLHAAEMIVIAGRPSMGKTALAMNVAEHVAVNQKKPVAVFSLEMSSQQLVQRMLCSRARVNLQRVRDGFLV